MTLKDVVIAARILFKRPGYTLTAVMTIALGVGASTAIFSVTHAVLLRPLPYPDPGKLINPICIPYHTVSYQQVWTRGKRFARLERTHSGDKDDTAPKFGRNRKQEFAHSSIFRRKRRARGPGQRRHNRLQQK
jgi:hypothetical protein